MPTVPLFDPAPPHPDGWHDVKSPGGYEWWYFDAEDETNDRQIVAIFFQGFVFHPGYLRADARFRRHPTRVPPAVAADFPCVYFIVYEHGKIRRQFLTQVSAQDFAASRDALKVSVGSNEIRTDNDQIKIRLAGVPWQTGGRGPALLAQETLSAQMVFNPLPTRPVGSRAFLSKAMTGADHLWYLANPLCRVAGTIQIQNETIAFAGRGYHDHNYGTAPIGAGVKRWMWGRVLRDDAACVFHLVEPRAADRAAEVHLIQVGHDSIEVMENIDPSRSRYRRTAFGLPYPFEVRLGQQLTLRRPRVIDSSPFYLRLQYAAEWNGQVSPAFCEVAYPHRLRWPVLGRMVEMSIDRSRLP